MNNNMNHLANEWFYFGRGRLITGNERPQTCKASGGIVGMEGCRSTFMAGIPGIEQIQCFRSAHFADQNSVWPHAQSRLK